MGSCRRVRYRPSRSTKTRKKSVDLYGGPYGGYTAKMDPATGLTSLVFTARGMTGYYAHGSWREVSHG